MAINCEICEREFKTTQGRRGHMTFVHQMTNTSDPPTRLITEQQPNKFGERVEQLTSKLELLEKQFSDLNTRVVKQTEQLRRLGECIITKGTYCMVKDPRIKEYAHDLEQLMERHEKLNRYIQHEIAGIRDNIVWEISLIRPELKSRSHKLK